MKRPERAVLEFNDSFTGRMRLFAAAAVEMHAAWALADATWEPHDWSEWT